MAQVRKGSTSSKAKKQRPNVRRGDRKGGETAIAACVCEIDLQDDDPIESYSVSGGTDAYFRPKYKTSPKCTGHADCTPALEYTWSLSNAVAMPAGALPPQFGGKTTESTCIIVNRGTFKLKVEVRLKCSRPGEGGVFRISRCSDSGEAEFERRP